MPPGYLATQRPLQLIPSLFLLLCLRDSLGHLCDPPRTAPAPHLVGASLRYLLSSLFYLRVLGKRCTSGNVIAGVSLRTPIPPLTSMLPHLPTSSHIPPLLPPPS